jgi:hypothetical protein
LGDCRHTPSTKNNDQSYIDLKEYTEDQREWLGGAIGKWNEYWEYRSYQKVLSPAQFKRAEILYAKYSREWKGIDEQTRRNWLAQMYTNAPQWKPVFALVTSWFDLDAKMEQAMAIWRQQKARAVARRQREQEEARARQQREAAVAAARRSGIEWQRKCYRDKVAMWLFGLSTFLGFIGVTEAWGWQGVITLLLIPTLICPLLPIAVHMGVCFGLAELITRLGFQPTEQPTTKDKSTTAS